MCYRNSTLDVPTIINETTILARQAQREIDEAANIVADQIRTQRLESEIRTKLRNAGLTTEQVKYMLEER